MVDNPIKDVLAKSKQVPISTVAADMIAIVRRAPFTVDELNQLYHAVIGRLPSKTCVRCGKLKLENYEGTQAPFHGENRFVCIPCQEVLIEKGQL